MMIVIRNDSINNIKYKFKSLMTPSKIGRRQASDVDFEDDSDDSIIILLLMRKIILTPMTPSKIGRMQ